MNLHSPVTYLNKPSMRLPICLAAAALCSCANTAPHAALEEAVSEGRYPDTTSVIVQRRDELLLESYLSGDSETLRDTRSVTKSVTMLAAGAALQSGAIASLNDPIGKYFPAGHPIQLRSDGYADITFKDLLRMSSRLDCNDNDPASPGNEENMYPNEEWLEWVYALPLKAEARPGWSYCTAGVVLLGKAIEQAVGAPIDQFTESHVLRPLGIERQNWDRSPTGEPMTGGSLELTSRAYAALAQLILDEGDFEGRQILPAWFVREATAIQHVANAEQDYGYLLWRRDYQTPCGLLSGWYMAGNGGNAVIMFPEIDTAAIITRTRYSTHQMHQETIDLVERHVMPLVARCPG